MREPAKVVATVEIANAVRDALADGMERHRSTGWDEGILLVELGRTMGALLRFQDDPPSSVERFVDAMRRAYSGLLGSSIPDAEDLVRELCPEATPAAASIDAVDGSLVQ
jgi:hypothetical protein